MEEKTRVVVLQVTKHTDSTHIVECYSERFGRMALAVRLPRSRKALLKPVLFQPLHLLDLALTMNTKGTIHTVREAHPAVTYQSIPYEPVKTTIALFLAETLYHTLRREVQNEPLFLFLQAALEWLDGAERDYANFHLVFLLRLTRFLGIFPNTEQMTGGTFFDLLNAEFTPIEPKHPSFLKPAESALVKALLQADFETMSEVGLSGSQRSFLLETINHYYRLHLPQYPELKSLKILHEILR